jgi:hypothetical protein
MLFHNMGEYTKYTNALNGQSKNGRVVLANDVIKDMKMYDETGEKMKNFQVETLYGIQETTQLNQLFFSQKNMDIIQNQIRHTVYLKTDRKHIIDRQSDIELEIVMRSIYLQHSPNLDYKLKEQIQYLNGLVIEWCVETIIPQVQQYLGYLKEIEYYPMPIDLPVNLSSKGTRTLRSVTTTF